MKNTGTSTGSLDSDQESLQKDAAPHISVVIPAYNRSSTVARAIHSALSQTVPPLEVLVIDDGSTDDTLSVIGQFSDPRVRCVSLSPNRGAQHARIRGVQEAKGEVIAFLDSDDEWFSDSLERRLSSFAATGFSEGLIYGDVKFNGAGGESFRYARLSGHHYGYLLKELSLCPFSVMMISRSCFDAAGFPAADFPSWQDDDTVLTIGSRYPVHHCGALVAIMYRTPACISSNKQAVYEGCRRMVAKYAAEIIAHHGDGRLWLWKLRVASSWLCMMLDRRIKGGGLVGKYLFGGSLFMLHLSLKLILKPFFSRVNS